MQQFEKKRWHDTNSETQKALEFLASMDRESQRKFSQELIDVAIAVKSLNNENEEPPLSIGIDRVLGLYKASQSRRWYDKRGILTVAVKEISSLPESDYNHIIEGICLSAGN